MSCPVGFQYLLVRVQLTSSLLLRIQSSLALQQQSLHPRCCSPAGQGVRGRVYTRPGLHHALRPPPPHHPPGPQSTLFRRALWELLVLFCTGKQRLLFLQGCLPFLVPEGPREASGPHVSVAWGGERGSRVGKHLFLVNKRTHFFRQMSWGGKDMTGDQQ